MQYVIIKVNGDKRSEETIKMKVMKQCKLHHFRIHALWQLVFIPANWFN